jgi:hypothetical protein
MIRKAVFSYFNANESFGNTCGFVKFSDFLFTSALSIFCASRNFPEVQFISSSWGVDLFKELKLPITSYSAKLDEIKDVSRFFWAYGKLLAYNEQTEPFVHIDNDVFIWRPLPDRILNAQLCFQSHEPFDQPGYVYYKLLKPCFDKAPVKPRAIEKNPVTDYAYNCGICGGNDLRIFKEWIKCSKEYIFARENQRIFFYQFPELLIHQNLFHEQYFLASLVKKHHWRKKVEVLHKDAMKINEGMDPAKPLYTHLWGTTKKDSGKMAKVRMTLVYQAPEVFRSVNDFCIKNKIAL